MTSVCGQRSRSLTAWVKDEGGTELRTPRLQPGPRPPGVRLRPGAGPPSGPAFLMPPRSVGRRGGSLRRRTIRNVARTLCPSFARVGGATGHCSGFVQADRGSNVTIENAALALIFRGFFWSGRRDFEPSTPTLARLCSTPELHPASVRRVSGRPVGRRTERRRPKRGFFATASAARAGNRTKCLENARY